MKLKGLDKKSIVVKGKRSITFFPAGRYFHYYGFPFENKRNPLFRLDESKKGSYPKGVLRRCDRTAGGRIRFQTDAASCNIWIRLKKSERYSWFALSGGSGIDIYTGAIGAEKYVKTLSPSARLRSILAGNVPLHSEGKKEVTVYLPAYSSIRYILFTFPRESSLYHAKRYSYQEPLVFYGSSITQGCSSSRPALSFPALTARRFHADFVNLGFSSSAKGEGEIAAAVASIKALAYVLEYDHNAGTPEELKRTHLPFYKKLREKNPLTPIILLSRFSAGLSCSDEEYKRREEVIAATYEMAVENGDRRIYFLSGEKEWKNENKDDFFVDGKHPNDAGMRLIAAGIIRILNEALNDE